MIEAKNRLEAACIFPEIIDNDSADSDLHVTTRRDGNRLIVSCRTIRPTSILQK